MLISNMTFFPLTRAESPRTGAGPEDPIKVRNVAYISGICLHPKATSSGAITALTRSGTAAHRGQPLRPYYPLQLALKLMQQHSASPRPLAAVLRSPPHRVRQGHCFSWSIPGAKHLHPVQSSPALTQLSPCRPPCFRPQRAPQCKGISGPKRLPPFLCTMTPTPWPLHFTVACALV